MSGCFFIIAMQFLSFFMALSDIDWHFFIIAWSLLDIELPCAKAAFPANARTETHSVTANALFMGTSHMLQEREAAATCRRTQSSGPR
jgi:hypothetical protein